MSNKEICLCGGDNPECYSHDWNGLKLTRSDYERSQANMQNIFDAVMKVYTDDDHKRYEERQLRIKAMRKLGL